MRLDKFRDNRNARDLLSDLKLRSVDFTFRESGMSAFSFLRLLTATCCLRSATDVWQSRSSLLLNKLRDNRDARDLLSNLKLRRVDFVFRKAGISAFSFGVVGVVVKRITTLHDHSAQNVLE